MGQRRIMNVYNIDTKEAIQDLLACFQDGSFSVSSFNAPEIAGTLNGEPVKFIVENQYLSLLPVSEKYDRLIYGKDQTENIVSVEVVDNVLIKFIEKDGQVFTTKESYKPWLITAGLINKDKQTVLEGKQAYKWMTEFDSYEEWKKAKSNLYGKRDFYVVNNLKEQAMLRNGMTYFKGMKLQDVSVLSFDIEAAGLKKDSKSKVFCITNVFRNSHGTIKKHFYLDDYEDDEQSMLTDWCNWVRQMNPSVILGHNIYSYDLPYLDHCCANNLFLGRDGSKISFSSKPRQKRKDGTQSYEYFEAKIFGRELIDTMFLAITYDIGRKYESYGLKSIIKQEGLEKPDRTFIDASQISFYYENRKKNPEMWEKVKQYAAEDADDALKLYDLMMPAFFYMTQNISKPFQEMLLSATGSQINNMMVRSYLQEGHSIAKACDVERFEGGISMGINGIYKNTLKWDIVSAYPHTIIQYELNDDIKDPFRNFLKMVKYFTKERIKNKKLSKSTGQQYYEDLQQSMKVVINSFFGFCGAPGLNYNSPQIAARITRECRGYIEKAILWATGKTSKDWGYIPTTERDNDEE